MLLDAALTVSDPSSATLASATVSIGAGFIAGDTLNFTNQNGITGSYNAATGVLTLTGSTSVANYQAALNSITYSFTPTNGDPTDTTRTISWVVNDGVTSSAAVTSTLDITTASETEHWVGTSSANWATVSASDWSLVSPPSSENPAVIDANGTYTITISSADVAKSLTINDTGATLLDGSGGSLTLGGAVAIDAGTFEFDGGTLAGVSTLTISAGGALDAANPTAAVIIDTGNAIVSEGTLEASSGGDLVIRDQLENEGGTISIQDGTVELGVANALTVDFSGTGGTLRLDNTVTGGAAAGVDAKYTGTAGMIITGTGQVTSAGADGIDATSAGGNITITPAGSVTGAGTGIFATQKR